MNFCADSSVVECPALQPGEGGSIPTPALHLRVLTLSEANVLLHAYHYLGGVRTATRAIGNEEGTTVWGVMRSRTWMQRLVAAGFTPLELIRMVGKPGKTWATSSLLSRSLRWLKEFDCFVTYADREAGHTGTVYRAANWVALPEDAQPDGYTWRLDGKIVSRKRFFSELGTSAIEEVRRAYGNRIVLTPDVPKRRFFLLRDPSRRDDFLAASKKKKTWGAARTSSYENPRS